MKKTILISVIVPVYNTEKYLNRCIESILNQTFQDFELILVNDGSTDDSLRICKYYTTSNDNIKLISQKNKGLSAARNTGLKNSRGKYVCFVDSDDFIEKQYLEVLCNTIIKNNSDIAMCELYLTNENGYKCCIEKFKEPLDCDEYTGLEILKFFFDPKTASTANVVTWNKIYKKEIFNNLKFAEGRYYEDEFIAVPLYYKVKKVSIIRKPLYNYVQRSNSIVNSPMDMKKIIDRIDMNKERISFCKKHNLPFYEIVVQNYINWIINTELTYKTSKNLYKDFQHDFRKYHNKEILKGAKFKIKYYIGFINLHLLCKLLTISKKWKSFICGRYLKEK